MPRTELTVHVITREGLDESTVTPDASDVGNGNSLPNNGKMWVRVKNTNSGSTGHDMTFALPGSFDGQGVVPRTKTIAAGHTLNLGPWPIEAYGGELHLNGAHAELTITAYTLTDS